MRSSRVSALRGGAAACAVLLIAALSPTLPATGVAPAGAVAQAPPAATVTDWHLAPSLARLRAEIDARWPERSRASDGALGDPRHRKSRNSHNPVGHKRGPEHGSAGSVHALDVTAAGIDTDAVLAAVIGDPRVWYVIFDGRIWSRTTGWAARRQSGDPHTTHIHISLRDRSQSVALAAERDTSRWLARRSAGSDGSRSATLSTRATVSLQKALIKRGYRIPSGPTGWYGPETTKAVRAFQRDQGWSGAGADGKAGAQTLRRLGVTTSDRGSTKSPKKKSAKKKSAKKKAAQKKAAQKKAAQKKAAKKKAAKKKAAKKKAGRYVPGTASVAVYYLQEALIERGYSIPAGPTGYFGTRTVAAVTSFQRAQGWSGTRADGVPGRATLALLGLD